jgi:hypothetical protein
MMTIPSCRVPRTTRVFTMLGNICTSMILVLLHPLVTAKDTKSLSLRRSTSPRNTLA